MVLDDLLNKKFEEVKKRFNYVPLKNCEFEKGAGSAYINMKNFDIKVDPDFIKKMSETNILSYEDALDAVLDHEIGHFSYHPFSIERVISESIKVEEFENENTVRQFYDDVNVNLRVMLKNPDSHLPKLYKAMSNGKKTDLEKVLQKFYEMQTNKDFGAGELDENLMNYVEFLKEINFLNLDYNYRPEFVKNSDMRNLQDLERFYEVIKPLITSEDEKNAKNSKHLQPGDFQSGDVRKSVKKLVQEGIISRDDVDKFVKKYADKFQDYSLPGGSYNDDPESFANRFFYESLAQKHKIKIKKTPIVRSDGTYPTSLDKFDLSDSPADFDPFSSGNPRILPGISNKWIKETIASHGTKEKTPDLYLLLDDSASMPDPTVETSYAVISSLAIAREYTKNNANVGVSLFSDRTQTFEKTKNYNEIAKHLLTYKKGNDTMIELKKIPTKPGADYIIITDGQISNKEKIEDFLNKNANRAYFITINSEKHMYVKDKIKYISVNNPEDIGKIVLDDIHKNKTKGR